MKILITNTQGRSGTTLLQSAISYIYKLYNFGEYIDYRTEQSYNNTTQHLIDKNNWCCKIFFDIEFDDFYQPVKFIQHLNPDLLINSFREDLFDQYLSLQISLHSNQWNSNSKLSFSKFTIEEPEHSIKKFLINIKTYESQLNILKTQFKIYNVSYEQILNNNVVIDNKIDIETALQSIQNTTVKQNTKQEKLSLINNISEVKQEWKKLNV